MDREALRMLCSPQFWRMAVLWALSLLHSYLLVFHCGRADAPRRRRPRPAEGRCPICVVTGATSGLGRAAAAALAREGYHVVLGESLASVPVLLLALAFRRAAGRSTQLLYEQTVQEIQRQQPDAHLKEFQVDLASFKSIKKFGSSLKQWVHEKNVEPSIQLLVNNAGILAKSHRITEDGLDEMIQTNYIGPFMLTNILLPLLKNSSVPSRVVNLTSFTHRCVSGLDVCEDALRGMKFGRCSIGESYPLASTYEYTKLCMLMFSYELHRQLHMSSGVSVIAADPGVVETKIMRELPECLSWFAFLALRSLKLLQEPDTGVGAVLDAALALPEESGKYFFGGKGRTIRSSRLSYDAEVAKKLWAESSAVFKELQLRGGDFGDS
ncbi:NAD(P)-binding Rossmann-fold superfamily protein [Zea mays]|uniref:NAD(P)-binding Rossmann-fold superfamily protein n=1 Tax=Zea mays TaxID=4577 RepID=A0A1D6I2K9_MAIZE|nr:NAD(P)-binding Rossmann-fold superfamily protein [Zea mays]